jgi:hypothetical protein
MNKYRGKYKKCRECIHAEKVIMRMVEIKESCPKHIKFSGILAVDKSVCETCEDFKQKGIDEKMSIPEMTPDDIKSAVEQPDRFSCGCEQHHFYVKDIKGKGTIIVYTEKVETDKYTVICADWLVAGQIKGIEEGKGN